MSKRIALPLLGAALLAAAVVLLMPYRRRQGPVSLGERAPDFTLPTLEGKQLRLGDYRHKVVVLNFWATWCPPCVEEAPTLEKFSQQMRTRNVAVIGVSVDQDREALEKFAREHRLSFTIARDPEQAIASRYGTSKFPETYILDRDGKIAERIVGPIDWQDARIISFVEVLAGNDKLAPLAGAGLRSSLRFHRRLSPRRLLPRTFLARELSASLQSVQERAPKGQDVRYHRALRDVRPGLPVE